MNARSQELIARARQHADKAARELDEASAKPGWAIEMLGAIRCILDANGSTAPAIMQSARKAQKGQADGKQ